LHVAGVSLQLAATTCALAFPLFRRIVGGGIPSALKARGFDFDGEYRLLDLAMLAVGRGGWDYLLSATFWIFIVICPLLRGITQLALLVLPLPLPLARKLHRLSRSISYYYALEVMLVAVPLLKDTFGPMTSTLFTPSVTHICGPLDRLYQQDACFFLDVEPSVGYSFVVASVVLYLLTGFDGSFTHKFIHRALFPTDTPPPTLPKCMRCRER